MVDIIHKHKITPKGILTYKEEESRQIFTSGNACFLRNWPYVWVLAQSKEKGSKVVGKVGIAPLPRFLGGRHASCLGGWNLAISKFSRHPKEAWKFIEFMTSYESQKYYSIKGGRLPTRKALYKDKDVLKKSPYYAEMYNVFINALPRPVNPNYSQISDILQVELHQALTQKKSPEQALKDAEKKIKKLL
jgi:multiple sugar transport system substrate-binding protein